MRITESQLRQIIQLALQEQAGSWSDTLDEIYDKIFQLEDRVTAGEIPFQDYFSAVNGLIKRLRIGQQSQMQRRSSSLRRSSTRPAPGMTLFDLPGWQRDKG